VEGHGGGRLMAAYKAIVALVIAKDESERDVYIYQDGYVPGNVTSESIERLVKEGFIEKVDEPAGDEPPFPEGDPSEDWTGKQLDAYAVSKSDRGRRCGEVEEGQGRS
jgi:hypothetical protein